MQLSAPALQVADVKLMSKAILNWLRGDVIDSPMFLPQYGRMFSKNYYLMEIK